MTSESRSFAGLFEAESGADLLYMLAFDHRQSIGALFGGQPGRAPSGPAADRARAAKLLALRGLSAALGELGTAAGAGLLVDEQFGGEALDRARSEPAIATAVAVESSGQAEFRFEYGPDFEAHVDRYEPRYAKALVRFNPGGDEAINRRQIERLIQLCEYLESRPIGLLFELLVPPTAEQLRQLAGDRDRYDAELRPELVCAAIGELRTAGIEPELWKIEGLETAADCRAVAAAAASPAGGRCLILGRGADEEKVEHWLRTAARIEGFSGFAVGRTLWWPAIEAWLDGSLSDADVVADVAARYLRLAALYTDAAQSASASG